MMWNEQVAIFLPQRQRQELQPLRISGVLQVLMAVNTESSAVLRIAADVQ